MTEVVQHSLDQATEEKEVSHHISEAKGTPYTSHQEGSMLNGTGTELQFSKQTQQNVMLRSLIPTKLMKQYMQSSNWKSIVNNRSDSRLSVHLLSMKKADSNEEKENNISVVISTEDIVHLVPDVYEPSVKYAVVESMRDSSSIGGESFLHGRKSNMTQHNKRFEYDAGSKSYKFPGQHSLMT